MNKEQRDGLFLDNSVFIADEKKPGFPLQSRIIQFLAILIGGWSSISILMEALPVPANVMYVNLSILLFTGIMFALCLIPSYDVVKMFFGLLFYALFFFSRLPKLKNGFYILENVVLERLSAYYNYQSVQYIADYSKAPADSTLLVIMITVPVVVLLTIAIVRSRIINLTSILLFLPVALCFLVGIIPSEKYLISYIAVVLYMMRSGFFTHHAVNKDQKLLLHRINSRAAVWLSLLSILLFFILKLFISEDQYDEISQINDMKTEIQTKLFNFTLDDLTNKVTNFQLPTIKLPAGGLNGGELGKVGKVEYTDSEQLQITASLKALSTGVYLKGYVGSVYTGDSWEGHSDAEDQLYEKLLKKMPQGEFAPVNQVSQLIKLGGSAASDLNLESMSIKYVDANRKYMYAPYFTDFSLMANVKYKQDLYAAPNKKKDNYTFVFYDPSQILSMDLFQGILAGDISSSYTPLMKEFSEYEKLYRDYVYQVYTKLPETGIDRLKQDFETVAIENPDFTIFDKISYVDNYLNKNTRYTLSPGKLPKGKDFVEYFLYENQKGYCAHYASAAALMLRAMGVPARYVEGYVVTPSDMTHNAIKEDDNKNGDSQLYTYTTVDLSVKDYNAHAWVEVYYDGCGWIPVDFTPVANIDFSEINKQKEQVSPTDIPTPMPEATVPPVNKPLQDNTKPDNTAPQSAAAASKDIAKQHRYDTLFLVIFIILLAGAAAGIITLLIYRKNKIRNTWNRNKRAIYLFTQIEKILALVRVPGKKDARLEDSEDYVKENCSYIDKENFTDFMETVRKARYGKGSISREELREAERFYHNLTDKLNNELPFMKRFYMKLLLSL